MKTQLWVLSYRAQQPVSVTSWTRSVCDVWQKYQICQEPTFFCFSLAKSEPTRRRKKKKNTNPLLHKYWKKNHVKPTSGNICKSSMFPSQQSAAFRQYLSHTLIFSFPKLLILSHKPLQMGIQQKHKHFNKSLMFCASRSNSNFKDKRLHEGCHIHSRRKFCSHAVLLPSPVPRKSY